MAQRWAAIFILIFPFSIFASNTAPGVSDDNSNFLGPVFQGQWTNFSLENAVSSVLFEGGPRDLRMNLTGGIGLGATQQNRLKLTGDFLTQDLDYTFFSGVTRHWVYQGAIGGGYEYAANNPIFKHFDLTAYYSYAPSFDLDPVLGSYTVDNTTVNYENLRRIAGSDAGGGEAGFYVSPWQGSEVGIAGDYDTVHYKNRYQPQEVAQGVGGTLSFAQNLGKAVELDLSGAVRAPFNEYKAGISWLKSTGVGGIKFGVFGDYTNGKTTLPNSTLVGVNVSYVGQSKAAAASSDEVEGLSQWAQKPAVLMPQVLAIADQRVQRPTSSSSSTPTVCANPQFNGPIPTQVVANPGAGFFSVASFFTPNTNVNYSMSLANVPAGVTAVGIDPTTGIISVSLNSVSAGSFGVVVTATDYCGNQAVSNQFLVEWS